MLNVPPARITSRVARTVRSTFGSSRRKADRRGTRCAPFQVLDARRPVLVPAHHARGQCAGADREPVGLLLLTPSSSSCVPTRFPSSVDSGAIRIPSSPAHTARQSFGSTTSAPKNDFIRSIGPERRSMPSRPTLDDPTTTWSSSASFGLGSDVASQPSKPCRPGFHPKSRFSSRLTGRYRHASTCWKYLRMFARARTRRRSRRRSRPSPVARADDNHGVVRGASAKRSCSRIQHASALRAVLAVPSLLLLALVVPHEEVPRHVRLL